MPETKQVAIATPDAVVDVAPSTEAIIGGPRSEVRGPTEQPIVAMQLPAAPSSFDDALAQGRELAAKGDHARARELFEAAARLDGKRSEPHLELARLFITTGDRGLAVAAANKAVKLAPNSTRVWNTKGRAELARFAYDDAVVAFTKAVELDHDNVWAWNNLGFTELELKKYGDAVEHLTEATTRKGATGYMWNNLGIALEQLDRLDEARTAFESGGKLGSQDALASRKRLEGVKTIAIANDVRDDQSPVTTPDAADGSGSGEASDHATE